MMVSDKLKLIFEGGKSLIYYLEDKKYPVPVVIKTLKGSYPSVQQIAHLYNELKLLNRLESPRVPKLYEHIELDNKPALVLSFFPGKPINQVFTDHSWVLADFLTIAIAVTQTLAEIHLRQVIHKDINSNNILLDWETKEVRIIDFGISSQVDLKKNNLGSPENLEGTLSYISPEQTGRMNRVVDHRTDLYSLGATFYELLTGRLPFNSKSPIELVHHHIASKPKDVVRLNPKVPQVLSDMVMKLLRKNAEDRYLSALGLKHDLEKIYRLCVTEKQIAPQFALATHDFSNRLKIPEKLYGRGAELQQLLEAFDLASRGKMGFVLVEGYSGVGKSALINEVHKPITEKKGYFIHGKFEQYQRDIPYSAITQAFEEFCNYLLIENQEVLDNWRNKLLAALGNNAQVLIEVIPKLQLILGGQPAVPELGYQEAQNRFNLVFRNFVEVISRTEHLLVLFIDDLQWADLASLALLKTILIDIKNKFFLIVGAYRDNEVDMSHPLRELIGEVKKDIVPLTITLKNLEKEHLTELMQDTLKANGEPLDVLAGLVYQKTRGNAFFSRQFLHSLYEEQLLSYDAHQQKWVWDIEEIKAKNITGNVVELMVSKIQKLPEEVQQILREVACIGNKFDLHTLALVQNKSKQQVFAQLWETVKEGMVVPLDDNYKYIEVKGNELPANFKFQHDRIQQAAYRMIPQEQRQQKHLQIGRLLLTNTADTNHKIFDITNHLNEARELINDPAEREKLARLNLHAGQKAGASTAHQTALRHYKAGMKLLPDNAWQTCYALSVDLYKHRAEGEYLNGHAEAAHRYIDELLPWLVNVYEKSALLQLKSLVYTNTSDNIDKARDTLLEAVRAIDNNLFDSEEAYNEALKTEFAELKLMLKLDEADQVLDLPLLKDNEKEAIVKLYVKAHLPLMQAQQSNIATLLIIRGIKLSLKEGVSVFLAQSLLHLGTYIGNTLRDYGLAFEYGMLAMKLNDKLNGVQIKSMINFWHAITLHHFGRHVRESIPLYFKAYQYGAETGDLMHAGFTVANSTVTSLLTGNRLPEVRDLYLKEREKGKKVNYVDDAIFFGIYEALLDALEGKSKTLSDLNSDTFDEANHLEKIDNQLAILHIWFSAPRLMLLIMDGKYNEALAIAQQHEAMLLNVLPTVFYVTNYLFYYTLVLLKLQGNDPKEDYTGKIDEHLTVIEKWVQTNPLNFEHQWLFLQAEQARNNQEDFKAIRLYEAAAKNAGQHKFIHTEALINEFAAQFYLDKNLERMGYFYLSEALNLYKVWGAKAKVSQVQTQYEEFFTAQRLKRTQTSSTTTVSGSSSNTDLYTTQSNALDLSSILKASQTLSQEVKVKELMEKMLHIVIENAGAEKGYLIDNQRGQLMLRVEGKANEVQELPEMLKIEDAAHLLPLTVIYYVERTHQQLLFDIACKDEKYSRDTYIQQHQTKSVLCFPVMLQGRLSIMFYLENNLSTGAFTPERMEVLNMLSSQIAISIENALLYNNLEVKVEERTNELAKALKEIKHTNLKIMDSIHYAKSIQQAILPSCKFLSKVFEEYFVLYLPKDVVSGDFYWVSQMDNCAFLAVVDCTGHGVPGAFMSMIGNTLLNEIINEKNITEPAHILQTLHLRVQKALKQNESENTDGMDVCLCKIEQQAQNFELTFAGAKRSLIYVMNNELGTIKGDRKSISGWLGDATTTFTQHKLWLKKGDKLYLSTDGYADSPNYQRRSFTQKRLVGVLQDINERPLENQKQLLLQILKDHQQGAEQRDDITLVGVRL